ncbi:MAG: hypothetical protein RJA97_683 [Bacteroidota bacterium]|jgi:prophage maintenance system killer protein
MNHSEFSIVAPDNQPISISVRFQQETVWLSQRQMADLFEKDTDTIGLHLKNIFREQELDERASTEDYSVVQREGQRSVSRTVRHYNLDAILSVGYRVNSKRGTQFRQWASQRLKEFLVQGIALNEERLAQANMELLVLRNGLRILHRALNRTLQDPNTDWFRPFSSGLELLDDYDHRRLDEAGLTLRSAEYPSVNSYRELIYVMRCGTESSLFGQEKDGGFVSAVHQIQQSFGGLELYPSLEEKAAMLLYLVVKNHAFVDGNKRIAAACFLLFLKHNSILYRTDGSPLLSNEALASLTLFAAVSKSEEFHVVKQLLMSILNRIIHQPKDPSSN